MKIFGVLMLLTVLAAALAYGWFPSVRESSDKVFRDISRRVGVQQKASPWPFYGLVVDQDCKPVAGAEVTVEIYALGPNPIMTGGIVRSERGFQKVTVPTDQAGKFFLQVTPPLEEMEIKSIEKPGYDWVIDWWWTTPLENAADNRVFNFVRGAYRGIYRSDPARPALFPLQLRGSTAPATRPSSGGSNIGTKPPTVYERTEWIIPSYGAGAPKNRAEIDSMMQRYGDRLNAEALEREQERIKAAVEREKASTKRSRRIGP